MTGHVVERFGQVNTVANCAKHYGVDVTDAMLVVGAMKGQSQGPQAEFAFNRAVLWPYPCKQDLKAIASTDWNDWYGK
jgi:hypothetical protein